MKTHPSFYEEEFKGNWMKFDSFAWSRSYDLDEAEDYGIFYTHNRDSGLIALANTQVIDEIMRPMVDNEIVFQEDHNHWACGWVAGYAIKVHDSNGEYTQAFLEYCKIRESLDDYPLLDGEIYSNMEYETLLKNIEQCYQEEIVWKGDYEDVELPEGWAVECASYLYDNYQCDTEDVENSWPDHEHIIEFMLEHNYIKAVEE